MLNLIYWEWLPGVLDTQKDSEAQERISLSIHNVSHGAKEENRYLDRLAMSAIEVG